MKFMKHARSLKSQIFLKNLGLKTTISILITIFLCFCFQRKELFAVLNSYGDYLFISESCIYIDVFDLLTIDIVY